jgi:hypothetical protein
VISWRDLEERAMLAAEAAEEGGRRAALMASLGESPAVHTSRYGWLRLKLARAFVQLGGRIRRQPASWPSTAAPDSREPWPPALY